jgi:hypothetical protein
VQQAQLGNLHYNAPRDWNHTDSNARSQPTSLWVPEENPHKESVEVIHTHLGPGLDGNNLTALENALEHAQIALPKAHVGSPTMFVTARGRTAIVVSADFVPAGANQPYHRVHAMIVDGKDVVHVLYTAAVADESESAFETVLQSIHSEGA